MDHAIVEIHVAGHGESTSSSFADQGSALRIFERHDEIFAGTGADAVGEQDEAAVVGVLAGGDDRVGERDGGVTGIGGGVVAEKRATVLFAGLGPTLEGAAHERSLKNGG